MCSSSLVQLLSHVRVFATPWTAALQAFLSITNSQSLLKLTSIELVMPSRSHVVIIEILKNNSQVDSRRKILDESISVFKSKVVRIIHNLNEGFVETGGIYSSIPVSQMVLQGVTDILSFNRLTRTRRKDVHETKE